MRYFLSPALRSPMRALPRLSALGLALLIAAGTLLAGCDSFLETTPQGNQTTENFYISPDDARKAVIAAYSGLQDPGDYRLPYVITFGEVASDNAVKGGESGNDQPDIQAIQNYVHNPTNVYVDIAWDELYNGVHLSNLVITNVPEIDMDEDLRARYVAEAKFLRAYYYHYLLLLFGLEGEGVPMILQPVQNDDADAAKTPEAEVWAQIETDLNEAAAVLPASYNGSERGRATKGAAQALLAKAHMFQRDWAAAETAAEAVMNGPYRLAPDYAQIFTLDGEFGPGSIFEVDYENINAAAEGTDATVYQTSRSTWGYGFNCPTEDLVDTYELNDPRLEATVIFNGEQMPDGSTIDTGASPTGYHNQKIWIPSSAWPQNNGGDVLDGPTNRRVLRLAQVLLWHAEATAEQGKLVEARESLNRVRRRARDADNDPSNDPEGVLPDVTADNQGELLSLIYREQRVELAMESHRMFTLVRQGRAAPVMQAFGKNFVEGTHERLPVPQLQIDLSENVISQNPGY